MFILATVRFTQAYDARSLDADGIVYTFAPGDEHVHASVRTWHPESGNNPHDPRNEWETTPDDGRGINPCQASVTFPGSVVEITDWQAESL